MAVEEAMEKLKNSEIFSDDNCAFDYLVSQREHGERHLLVGAAETGLILQRLGSIRKALNLGELKLGHQIDAKHVWDFPDDMVPDHLEGVRSLAKRLMNVVGAYERLRIEVNALTVELNQHSGLRDLLEELKDPAPSMAAFAAATADYHELAPPTSKELAAISVLLGYDEYVACDEGGLMQDSTSYAKRLIDRWRNLSKVTQERLQQLIFVVSKKQ